MNITAQTQIKSSEYPEGFLSESQVLKIQTVTKLSGSVAFSSGALPPQNGKSSVYHVSIAASDSTNDIDDATVTLNLPNSNNFDPTTINAAESGKVTYDRNTRKLTWSLGKLTLTPVILTLEKAYILLWWLILVLQTLGS